MDFICEHKDLSNLACIVCNGSYLHGEIICDHIMKKCVLCGKESYIEYMVKSRNVDKNGNYKYAHPLCLHYTNHKIALKKFMKTVRRANDYVRKQRIEENKDKCPLCGKHKDDCPDYYEHCMTEHLR